MRERSDSHDRSQTSSTSESSPSASTTAAAAATAAAASAPASVAHLGRLSDYSQLAAYFSPGQWFNQQKSDMLNYQFTVLRLDCGILVGSIVSWLESQEYNSSSRQFFQKHALMSNEMHTKCAQTVLPKIYCCYPLDAKKVQIQKVSRVNLAITGQWPWVRILLDYLSFLAFFSAVP